MKLLYLPAFCLFSVAKSFPTPISRQGNGRTIKCEGGRTSSIYWNRLLTEWRKDYVYPIEVCLELIGSQRPSCSKTEDSEIRWYLEAEPIPRRASPRLSIPINVPKFYEKASANEFHCQLIKASEMVSALQGIDVRTKDLPPTRMMVQANIYGEPKPDGESPSHFVVHVRSAPYFIESPGEVERISNKKIKLHAVICNFPKCKVVAEGPSLTPTRTENFRVKKNGFPQFDEESGPLTANMFSVTYFECTSTECPTKFVASKDESE